MLLYYKYYGERIKENYVNNLIGILGGIYTHIHIPFTFNLFILGHFEVGKLPGAGTTNILNYSVRIVYIGYK